MPRRALSLLRRSPLLVGLAVVLVLVMTGLGVAAALPGSGSTIHACIKKQGGALRVVRSAKDCKKSERAISFDKRGPRGLTGVAGAPGAQGPAGPAGSQGPAGKDAPTAALPHQAVIGTATLTPGTGSPIVFDVLGLDFQAANPTTIGSQSSGAGAGKVVFKPFTLVKRIDASSPRLAQLALAGTSAGTLVVDLRTPGSATPYRSYHANSVQVASTQQDAPDAGGRPVESVTFTAGLVPDPPSGAPSQPGTAVGRISFTNADGTIGPVPAYGSSYGITNSGTGTSSGGAGAGKATLSAITVRKSLDAASAALFSATASGAHFDSAKLELFSRAGQADVIHTYDLGTVFVTSFHDQATGETATTPVQETVDLTAMTVRETEGGNAVCWDQTTNAPCTP
jgi:type VI protein secretion system component Hcp